MEATLFFDDDSSATLEVVENVLIEQMKRPKHKRLYVCGIEFSRVERVEV